MRSIEKLTKILNVKDDVSDDNSIILSIELFKHLDTLNAFNIAYQIIKGNLVRVDLSEQDNRILLIFKNKLDCISHYNSKDSVRYCNDKDDRCVIVCKDELIYKPADRQTTIETINVFFDNLIGYRKFLNLFVSDETGLTSYNDKINRKFGINHKNKTFNIDYRANDLAFYSKQNNLFKTYYDLLSIPYDSRVFDLFNRMIAKEVLKILKFNNDYTFLALLERMNKIQNKLICYTTYIPKSLLFIVG